STTTSTSTSTSTSGSTSTTTTTTVPATVRCCVASSVAGAFDTCQELAPDACATAGGINNGPGACDPNPCVTTTTVTESTSTTASTSTSTSTTTTVPTTVRCCVASSVGGAFDTCQELAPDACATAGGLDNG